MVRCFPQKSSRFLVFANTLEKELPLLPAPIDPRNYSKTLDDEA